MKVFICHPSEYDSIVKKMEKVLKKYQIEYFVDHDHVRQGVSVNNKIDQGMHDATHFFLIWCGNAEHSPWIIDELETVRSPGYRDIIRLIPFVLDATLLPVGFSSRLQNKIDENNVEDVTRNVIKDILEIDVDMVDEFDDYLDEINPEVEIDGVFYPFSQVLKSVDKTKYNIRFHQWLEDDLESRQEFDQTDYSEDHG
jgi:hypothetical protein